jgi:hypothetical protein
MASRVDLMRYYVGRLGKVGMAGALLLLGSLVFLAVVVQSKQSRLEDLAARNEQMRMASAAEKSRAARQGAERAQQSALAPEAAEALRRLYDAADQSGLELLQGEYRLLESKEGGVRQYQFLLPVSGTYADVRKFLVLALNNEPALALTSLQMRREAIEETELDVALSFTLYLGKAP